MHWLDMEQSLALDLDAPEAGGPGAFKRFRDALTPPMTGLIAAALAAPLAVALLFLMTPPQFRAEARISAAPASTADANAAFLGGEAWLIASRDLGRRAIKALDLAAMPEFDPVASEATPFARALVILGLAPDYARLSPGDRVLRSYESRLSVSASEKTGLIDVAFRSRDPAFAAAAANQVSALYIEMRERAQEPDGPAVIARMIAPASVPLRPMAPSRRLIAAAALGGAALAVIGFGAVRRPPRRRMAKLTLEEAPLEPPQAVGGEPAFVRLGGLRPSASGAEASRSAAAARADGADAIDDIARRILAARRDGGALRIVGAALTQGDGAADLMLRLARRLGDAGRSILLCLDDADGAVSGAPAQDGEPGVRDLLAATASFAEAIRRDPPSRLHIIPAGPRASADKTGAGGEHAPIDIEALGEVLDALTRTYDFIWLLAPALDPGGAAWTLADGADFFVLAAPPRPRGGALAKAEADLRACGARDVLAVCEPLPQGVRLGQDAA